jgi:thiaminase/transcriptional activator TenA
MLHDELLATAEPALRKVIDHPFWAGLRDGSLPGEALAHFVGQDTAHLLPAYGRALARCAAVAPVDEHAVFFARSVTGTLAARDRLRAAFDELAPSIGVAHVAGEPPVDPLTHAHCSFFQAAAATSLLAGLGALLPMAWFNHRVSADLAERCVPGSVYEPWIALYQPSDGYVHHVVQRYLDIVDEVGERCSAPERAELADHFSTGVRYEWLFAESAWRRPHWPV